MLARKSRLVEVRAELRELLGHMEDHAAHKMVIGLLREHEELCSALAYGHRDGVVRVELGVHIGYTRKDMTQVLEELMEHGPDQFTLPIQRRRA